MRLLRKAGEGGGHEPPWGDDGDLLARSLREPAAFEGLVERHSTALHGYPARRAAAAADDLLSEVWLRAFAGRSGYDPERGTVRDRLFGVARHVPATHWRAAETAGPLGPEPVADPWHAVDQRLDAGAVAPLIRRTLAALPHAERELLLLVVWEQLTPAEAVVGVRAALRAALFRVLAGTPGIHLDGTAKDSRGRSGTMVSVAYRTGGSDRLYVFAGWTSRIG